MPYCKKCGKPVGEGQTCPCSQESLFIKLKRLLGHVPHDPLSLEGSDRIVPDIANPEEDEILVKQYDMARLRSRIRGQYAIGRLAVTNKRVVLRAPGISSLGKTYIHHEVAIENITGVEIQHGNRVSFLSILVSLLVSILAAGETESLFFALYSKTAFLSIALAIIAFFGAVAAFFLVRKHHWVKLLILSLGVGALLGSSGVTLNIFDLVLGFEIFTVHNALIFLLVVLWFISLLKVCFLPDLIFVIQANGSEAIHLQRKKWGVFIVQQPQEFSGFSEILPGPDTETMTAELSGMIGDLQTMGDLAVDKWKEI